MIFDIERIKREIEDLKQLKKSDDRLEAARKLKKAVADAEAECARDFSIPFDVVVKVRQQIPIIEGHVSRLESGLIRRGK